LTSSGKTLVTKGLRPRAAAPIWAGFRPNWSCRARP